MSPRAKPTRNVVDSSGWLEYLAEAPNAEFFAPAIEDPEHLVVPALGVLEVFKWVLRERGEDAALQAAALMQQGHVVELDVALAVRAAKLGVDHRLPLADSVMLATAQALDAVLWTQDADFEGLPGVNYTPKHPRS
ncbi:MAG: type II toxin-antitoxin system VapC family toxin [Chloroflexota bacterium]|nr:type II toxin-antitoxin system VapC family toxin [Chloroflexota bacterium]